MNQTFFENIRTGSVLFSRFTLLRCLSAQDGGGIYLCRDLYDADYVALKVFSVESLRAQKALGRFREEARLAFSVRHPHVVRCRDYFEDHCFIAFSMDYASGHTLREAMQAGIPHSVDDIIALLRKLASGLAALHEAGIIHRDLKPENILMEAGQSPKITDFGIAVMSHGGDAYIDDVIHGTIDYVSPEYIARGIYSPVSDLYSLGVIAHELVAGKLPFYRANMLDSLTRRVTQHAPALSSIRPDMPPILAHLIDGLLDRSPERRPQTAREVEMLLAALEDAGEPSRSRWEQSRNEARRTCSQFC